MSLTIEAIDVPECTECTVSDRWDMSTGVYGEWSCANPCCDHGYDLRCDCGQPCGGRLDQWWQVECDGDTWVCGAWECVVRVVRDCMAYAAEMPMAAE